MTLVEAAVQSLTTSLRYTLCPSSGQMQAQRDGHCTLCGKEHHEDW